MHSTAEMLKARKLKVTPQRLAIYTMLRGSHEHPSAEMIHHALSEQYPTMSLATVYKTLDTFKEAGLVVELSVGEDCLRYDARIDRHSHLICQSCKSVYDLDMSPDTTSLWQAAEELHGFKVQGEQLNLFGVCAACREAEQGE